MRGFWGWGFTEVRVFGEVFEEFFIFFFYVFVFTIVVLRGYYDVRGVGVYVVGCYIKFWVGRKGGKVRGVVRFFFWVIRFRYNRGKV